MHKILLGTQGSQTSVTICQWLRNPLKLDQGGSSALCVDIGLNIRASDVASDTALLLAERHTRKHVVSSLLIECILVLQ